jgi:hypothetical protein
MPQQLIPAPEPLIRSEDRRQRVRSLLIGGGAFVFGTVAVAAVAAIAPFNDYVVNNTFMIGSYLPLVVVLTLFFLVVFFNAPLSRFAPDWALRPRDLALILAMLLPACAIPTQGLLRFWLPMLVAPFSPPLGGQDAQFWEQFVKIDLPGWMFPVQDIAGGRTDPIVTWFYNRVPEGEPIPYGAWIVPLLGWAVFLLGWMTALVTLALMVVPQWAFNERLPFPLAQIQAAVIEPPMRRRWFNDLFSSRVFWIGLAVVYLIHNLNALRPHFPQNITEIPLRYNFNSIFSEEPWRYLNGPVKAATIYFTFIGVTFFIQSRVAFSLWAIYLISELYQMELKVFGTELPAAAKQDQHLGAALAFAIGVLWIGRAHWGRIGRHLIRGAGEGETRSYRAPAILFLLATGVMIAWLIVVGTHAWVACAVVGMILLSHFVVTRFVAETGVPFWRFQGDPVQIWRNVPQALLSPRDVFVGGMVTMPLGPMATRESLMSFSTHAYRIEQAVEPERPRYGVLTAAMSWALLVAIVVGTFASLRMYYTHALPITAASGDNYVNPHGLEFKPRDSFVNPTKDFARGWPSQTHTPAVHMGIGMAITGLLQTLALRYSAWPFMPVGYVAAFTWYMETAWYSIMIGWLCKVLILRFGGSTMFMQIRPLFVGMIFGEALAAATWLVVNLVLASGGYTYYPVNVLPT